MITRIFIFICLCSFLSSSHKTIQASEWDHELILKERKGKLCPSLSCIPNVDFWNEYLEDSWYIACNYLGLLQKCKETLINDGNKELFKCIGASYLRINYRLQDSEKPNNQALIIRKFEPCVAEFVNNGRISLDSLWLKGLPEIYPRIIETGVMQVIHTTEVPPKFLTKLPSSYLGTILWIGGERNEEIDFQDRYILNVDKNKKPDILADGSNAYHFMVFPDKKFNNIIFEHIGHTVLSQITTGDVLEECHRILTSGGMLTFKTEHSSENYYQKLIKEKLLQKIKKNITKNGFQIDECEIKQDSNKEWKSFPYYISVIARKN